MGKLVAMTLGFVGTTIMLASNTSLESVPQHDVQHPEVWVPHMPQDSPGGCSSMPWAAHCPKDPIRI